MSSEKTPKESLSVTQLTAGRELDQLVAQRVFGWGQFFTDGNGNMYGMAPPDINRRDCPHDVEFYSTSIAAAWEVVEKLKELNDSDVFEFRLTWSSKERYIFRIWESDLPHVDLEEFESETVPHAICLAALKAVGDG